MFKKEPAVVVAILAAIVAALAQLIDAGNSPGGSFDLWNAVVIGAPLLAGIAIRYTVVPVETVRTAIFQARSVGQAVSVLADKVDVAIADRPNG